jgi:NADPH:quinone reductase-like Zn-dependent oxidoreductase
MTGLTAWQGLFDHGRLQPGRSVIMHGVASAVGSMATQLASEAGAHVIGAGGATHRQKALDFRAHQLFFIDLDNDALEDIGGVDPCSISSVVTSGSSPLMWSAPEERS